MPRRLQGAIRLNPFEGDRFAVDDELLSRTMHQVLIIGGHERGKALAEVGFKVAGEGRDKAGQDLFDVVFVVGFNLQRGGGAVDVEVRFVMIDIEADAYDRMGADDIDEYASHFFMAEDKVVRPFDLRGKAKLFEKRGDRKGKELRQRLGVVAFKREGDEKPFFRRADPMPLKPAASGALEIGRDNEEGVGRQGRKELFGLILGRCRLGKMNSLYLKHMLGYLR